MSFSDMISVFVPTHIVRADTEPYIENLRLVNTLVESHKAMNLDNVNYYIYPDARFNNSHPELMKKYYSFLDSLHDREELKSIKIHVVRDSRSTMRSNWEKFINEDCKTPYMLFLEHDWGFNQDVPMDKILKAFEENIEIGYLKFSRFKISTLSNLCSKDSWDWMFERDTELNVDFPLYKISFFSGNPHVARVDKCKNFYIPEMIKYCPPEKSKGTSHLEKDLKKAEMYLIDSFRDCGYSNYNTDGDKAWGHQWPLSEGSSIGKSCPKCEAAIRKQQKVWGTYMFTNLENPIILNHTGEHCRKQ